MINNYTKGFSLVELTIWMGVAALILSATVLSNTTSIKVEQQLNTYGDYEKIHRALESFARLNKRLPCPADITLIETTSNFGIEGATPGTCTGGNPAANFDDSSNTVAGMVPVKTLNLPDSFAFDAHGNRITYHVDKRMTAADATDTYASNDTTIGSITINDADAAARTEKAIYALVSHGLDDHGAYTRSGVRANKGSVNTDQLENCDCTNTAGSAAFDATLVQRSFVDTADNDKFDDIVYYKLRSDIATTGAVTSTCTDEHWSNVVLLMNFDSDLSDSSNTPHTATANGDATVSATQKKFGAGAVYFDGTGDYLTIPDNVDFEFGSGDWTIEYWLYLQTTAINKGIFGKLATGGYGPYTMHINDNGTNYGFFQSSGSQWSVSSAPGNVASTQNQWVHFAYVRNGSTTKTYINGTEAASHSSITGVDNSAPLYIGGNGFSNSATMTGYIDDVRITKGVARYTSSFTPPTEAFCTSGSSDDSGNNSEPTSSCPVSSPTFQQTFSYTGSDQSFTVPSGIGCVQAKLWGAAGSGGGPHSIGAPGGYTTGEITVSPNQSLAIVVGGGGAPGTGNRGGIGGAGGYGGGGKGSDRKSSHNSGGGGGGGGGYSGIFASSIAHSNALLIAGGGGGGGYGTPTAGGGGGTTGQSAGVGPYNSTPGGGGTQSSTPNYGGGGKLQGGSSGSSTAVFIGAGGGGGGYYGGGAGNDAADGGGGGSGFCHATVSNCTLTAGTGPTDNLSTANPPNTSDTDYATGIGRANRGSTGGHGRIVLKW